MTEHPLFDVRNPTEAGLAWVRRFTTDDLDVLYLPLLESMLPWLGEILEHPALDRGTALKMLDTCSPVSMEEAWKADRLDLTAGTTDRVYVDILDRVHARLLRPFASTRMHAGCIREWLRFPARSPLSLTRWRLPPEVLRGQGSDQPRPRIRRYDTAVVALSDPSTW